MSTRVSFDVDEPLILIDGRVEGPNGTKDLRLVLDTGASRTVLDETAVGHLFDLDSAETRPVITASGHEDVKKVRIDVLSALGGSKVHLDVYVMKIPTNTGANGLLGLDFLRGSKLTIDFDAGEITLG